jgi:hypothetical protein
MSTANVTITSEPLGQFLSVGPTSEESVQFARAVVQIEGDAASEHSSIVASGSSLPHERHQGVLSMLANENPQSVIALIVREFEGSATVLSEPEGYEPFQVAAAVAVFKASWGWEEASPLLVNINGTEIAVRARFNGETWVVSDV